MSVPDPKPLLNQVDVWGCTNKGKVRETNADHFLVASFHRAILVHAASVAPESLPAFSPDSRGFVFLVADGVGSMSHGAEGSAHITDTIARSLIEMSEVSLLSQPNREHEVLKQMGEIVSQAHLELQAYAREVGGGAATTITVCHMIWPCCFIAHAGDSRAYRMRDGKLQRLTTDQTMAQALVDSGTMSPQEAEASKFRNVLLSAAGGRSMDLDLSVTDIRMADRWLLCTDGLIKHVDDGEIAAALQSNRTSRECCDHLLNLVLDRGAEDNVTIIVAGARRQQ
jgi:protein phosphatase